MASSARIMFSQNKKVALLEEQLSRRKKASCSMLHYLCDKLDAAESFRKTGREISEDEIKELIFAGLPAELYADYIREIQGNSLMVIGNKLAKYEKDAIRPGEEAFEARRWRGSDRIMHRGDILVIMALVVALLFGVGANPSDVLFEPLHRHTDCTCHGSGPTRVCTCTPFLFLIFESALAAGFTIALLLMVRMTADFRLRGWIWASLAFVCMIFLMSIYIVTPWKYRLTMMVADFVAILSVCLLMGIIRYWRPIWSVLKLLWLMFVGGVKVVCKKIVSGFKKVGGRVKVVCKAVVSRFKKIAGGVKLAWNGAPVPPVPQVPALPV